MGLHQAPGRRVGCTGCGVQVPISRFQVEKNFKFPHGVDCLEKNSVYTDCRSEDGITVGLIDAIIVTARMLHGRSLAKRAIKEALKDLREDAAVQKLLREQSCTNQNT